MKNRTAQEMEYPCLRDLLAAVYQRMAAPRSSSLSHRNLSGAAGHRGHWTDRHHCMEGLQISPLPRKMVKRSGHMRKHCIQDICWNEVKWERPFDLEAVWETLTHLSSLEPRGAVIWECRGRNGHITHLLGADQIYISKIKEAFRAHGDVRFRKADERTPVKTARQLKITKPILSLNTDLAQAVVRAGLAAMTEDKHGAEIVLQVVLGRGFAPSPTPADLPDPHASWLSVILGTVNTATAESRKTVREKANLHGFQAAIRIGVSEDGGSSSLRSLISALKVLESAGVRIHDEPEKPERLNTAHVPWHFPIQRLSVKELANFLLLPAGEEELPGTSGLHPKLTLPPAWYRQPTSLQSDRSFAVSMDIRPQNLRISPRDSLEHSLLVGPTGSGKSTAMQHLILADIRAGRGVLVIDPKQDLITDILARIPENRVGDVAVLDPSDYCSPVGFNPLAFKNYKNKALIADAILSVLRELWRDSWGVRIQDILSAALLTLAEIDGATLLWLQPLLTDNSFRKRTVSQIRDKVGLMPFWNEFETLSDLQRQQWIAPVSNKLRQFTLRPGLRNVLGQAHPKFDLTELFTQQKIVLVPLNKGVVGPETARLLGSLIVGLTWTLALSRASLPPERRHIVNIYIDELQDYLSLPTDLSDALAQARGLGVGMTLAHQYRDQLPPEIRAGIDANCRNKTVFGLNSKDAKDMAAMAPELTAEDFMTLPRYQVYTSFQSGGRSTGWIMGRTLPPPPALRDPVELYVQSTEQYGVPAENVENEYLTLLNNHSTAQSGNATIGRRKC